VHFGVGLGINEMISMMSAIKANLHSGSGICDVAVRVTVFRIAMGNGIGGSIMIWRGWWTVPTKSVPEMLVRAHADAVRVAAIVNSCWLFGPKHFLGGLYREKLTGARTVW